MDRGNPTITTSFRATAGADAAVLSLPLPASAADYGFDLA
jgi:hypothetical protein